MTRREVRVGRTQLADFRDANGRAIDRGLVLAFKAPHSFTGEDCAEFHLHGGKAVVSRMLAYLGELSGLRHAEAGEFIRRAFLNGKMDLLEVEAIGDLIAAETEAQRRFALDNSGSAQSALYGSWRVRLLHARAMIEAELDFSDEGDVPGSVADAIWSDMSALAREITRHIESYGQAEMLRDGFRVVLVGPPNAGKSSLLNALARRDVAIVSDEPGTTRDVIEVQLDLSGYKVIVSDTAGLRDGAVGIEAKGIALTQQRMRGADLVLLLDPVDGSVVDTPDLDVDVVRLISKADLADESIGDGCAVSARTGVGLDALMNLIRSRIDTQLGCATEILPNRERQVRLFQSGLNALSIGLDDNYPLEVRAESLRLTDDFVGRVIGAVDAEDLLDAIFSQFCIGK
ncbi:tRNA uridine-5-carboxymethylaminomethyl(34) synthesis GTPase MnmE [Salmonella enterica subsp. enterica serovar Uganda]|nr:tRNA uridine-5-carboxymethylaminomethyl(34) synthesis GTPase MnmE [Salmonella enterica subsp. enterica serovar Newport]ECF1263592.1 tRNA uridine-5-carboxymethylaminomethyl(34) synthesis GTPase MnmE [Salmonella enterica subsp. enterica serovar Uganda]